MLTSPFQEVHYLAGPERLSLEPFYLLDWSRGLLRPHSGHDLGEASALRNQEADILDHVSLARVPCLLSPSRQNDPIAAILHPSLLVLEEGLVPEAPAVTLETLARLALRGSSFAEQGLDFAFNLEQCWVVLQATFQGYWDVAREARFVELLQALEVLDVAVVARLPQEGRPVH